MDCQVSSHAQSIGGITTFNAGGFEHDLRVLGYAENFRFHCGLDFRAVLCVLLRIEHSNVDTREPELDRRKGRIVGIDDSTALDPLGLNQMIVCEGSEKTTRSNMDVEMSAAPNYTGTFRAYSCRGNAKSEQNCQEYSPPREEGWTRHQENAAQPPYKERPGWSLTSNVSV